MAETIEGIRQILYRVVDRAVDSGACSFDHHVGTRRVKAIAPDWIQRKLTGSNTLRLKWRELPHD